MKFDKLTAQCAVEIAGTYEHARTDSYSVCDEYITVGIECEDETAHLDFDRLVSAVQKAFEVKDSGVKDYDKAVKLVMG